MDKHLARKFEQVILLSLDEATELLPSIEDGGEQLNEGVGFGDLKNDTEIKADKLLGEMFQANFLNASISELGRITVEGFEDIHCGDGEYWLCIDPLDGSLNYKSRGLTLGLPITVCITILQKKENVKFSDVVIAAVLDLRSPHDLWFVDKLSNGEYITNINGQPAKTWDSQYLDLYSQIVFGEMYYPNNRGTLVQMFDDERGWLRNPGSAAYEMAMVSSGQAVAYICGTQKQHELGAGYALVKGAGGVAVDWDGKDLGESEFLFNAQTPVILAANKAIADQILERLHRV